MTPKRARAPRIAERDVKRDVVEYLEVVKRWRVFVRQVGGRPWTDKTGKKRVMKFGITGQADLFGWIRGSARHFEIELKAPGEEPRPDQYEWLDGCRETGCVSFWCDSLDSLIAQLAALGL